MATQSLVFAKDSTNIAAEVESAGGRLVHALTPNLLVIELPDSVNADSIPGASAAEPGALDGIERALAEAWLSRFGRVSRAAERLAARATEPPLAWDSPGYTPPNRRPGELHLIGRGPVEAKAGLRCDSFGRIDVLVSVTQCPVYIEVDDVVVASSVQRFDAAQVLPECDRRRGPQDVDLDRQ